MSKSLNEVLEQLGYSTEPAGNGQKHIIRNGFTLFTGRAGDVWDWLRERGEYS